jgi:hypothetical protein
MYSRRPLWNHHTTMPVAATATPRRATPRYQIILSISLSRTWRDRLPRRWLAKTKSCCVLVEPPRWSHLPGALQPKCAKDWTYQGIISAMCSGVESGVDPTQMPGWQNAVVVSGLKLLPLVQADRARPSRAIAQTLLGTLWNIRLNILIVALTADVIGHCAACGVCGWRRCQRQPKCYNQPKRRRERRADILTHGLSLFQPCQPLVGRSPLVISPSGRIR